MSDDKRGPGRPKTDNPKVHKSIRIDEEILARLINKYGGLSAAVEEMAKKDLDNE